MLDISYYIYITISTGGADAQTAKHIILNRRTLHGGCIVVDMCKAEH